MEVVQLRNCRSMQLRKCEEIMESYKFPMPIPSADALFEILRGAGVLVDDNKYIWLDDDSRVGVQLYPKALTITWGSSPQYWTYISERIGTSPYTVQVAKLLNVCWLEVNGEFDMRKLTIGAEYEIVFDIELTRGAQGWNHPVTFEHNSPFGVVNKFEKRLDNLIGKGRAEISLGVFTLPTITVDTSKSTFRMYEYVGGQWKNGLILRGIIIKPVDCIKLY